MKKPEWMPKKNSSGLPFKPVKSKIKAEGAGLMHLYELAEKDKALAKNLFLSLESHFGKGKDLIYGNFLEANVFFIDKKGEIEIELENSVAMNFFVVRENAELFLVSRAGENSFFFNNIILGKNADAKVSTLKERCNHCSCFQSSKLGESASLVSASFWSGRGNRSSSAELSGKNSRYQCMDMALSDDSEKAHLNSVSKSTAPGTFSRLVMRGVVKDHSEMRFRGMVKAGKKADKTNGSLEQNLLVLNDGASAEAEPLLEIENNQSECEHSAAVHSVDERKLFYLQSRGLSRRRALTTVVAGFMHSALSGVEDKKMRKLFIPFE